MTPEATGATEIGERTLARVHGMHEAFVDFVSRLSPSRIAVPTIRISVRSSRNSLACFQRSGLRRAHHQGAEERGPPARCSAGPF